MTNIRLVLSVALLFAASPAAAHCYRYWHYPTAQRCSVRLAHHHSRATMLAQLSPTPPPRPTREAPAPKTERDRGLEALREKMGELSK